MPRKQDIERLISKYHALVSRGEISKEKLFKKLGSDLEAVWEANKELGLWALFDRIDRIVTHADDNIVQEQGEFDLNLNSVVPLGEGTRITYGKCDRDHLAMRREIISSNRIAVNLKADQEIAAIDKMLSRMGPNDLVEDVYGNE